MTARNIKYFALAKVILVLILGFAAGWFFRSGQDDNGEIYVNDEKLIIPKACLLVHLDLEKSEFGSLLCDSGGGKEGVILTDFSHDLTKLDNLRKILSESEVKKGYRCGKYLPSVYSCLEDGGGILVSSKNISILKRFLDHQ